MNLKDAILNRGLRLKPGAIIFYRLECCAMRLAGENLAESFSTVLVSSVRGAPRTVAFYFGIFANTENLAFIPTEAMRGIYNVAVEGEIRRLDGLLSQGDLGCGHTKEEHIQALREVNRFFLESGSRP